ncbi:MAG TPA: putative lipid II flippase FtsW [Candidatus Tyrphobacter sp.]
MRSSASLRRLGPTHDLAVRRSSVAAVPDVWLFGAVAALVGIGLVMIYSASSVTAYAQHLDTAYYVKRQFLWLLVGTLFAFGAYRIDYLLLRRFAPYILLAGFLGLVLVYAPHLGLRINGAHRWIGIRSFSLQPSEFAKLSLVIFLAAWLSGRSPRIDITKLVKGLIPACIPVAVMAYLVLKEPDLGTASLIVMTAAAIFFAAGARILHLAAVSLAVLPPLVIEVTRNAMWRARLFAFLNPWRDPQNTGFHIIQSLYALGSGGIRGVGLGASGEKFFYLPEQYTDFIFSVLGEEWGLIGALTVVALFMILAFRAIRIALAAEPFGFLLTIGCTAMIVLQAFVNIGVVTSSWPVTGVPLPFISFGGSSLVVDLVAVALILNVGRRRRASSGR